MTALPQPRVLLVGSALGGGGSETRLRLLAQHMFEASADVAVLQTNGREALSPEQTCHALGWTGSRSYPGVLRRLRAALRTHAYDAVVSFGLYPNTLAWVATRALARRPALIMTEITRPETESRLSHPARHFLTHAVRTMSYPAADLCAANSIDGVAEVVRHYGVDAARIRRLHNLVEPEKLAHLAASGDPLAGGTSPPVPSFCMITRLDPMKRVDTLLEAAAALPASLAWHIDIVGDGPERATLSALAQGLGIASRVNFRGWLKNPFPIVARATATVLTSSYEGFSNTVLESMALGTPVITSYCSSDARAMQDEGAALGFPVGDAAALTNALRRVLEDEDLRRSLAAGGRRYAQQHTLQRAIPEYETLVRDAVAIARAQQMR